jgi:MFS transporter, DHA1 family, tetracycline resistance protein
MASLVKQASLVPILLVNFVGTLGFSILLPFLVFVVIKFGGNAIVYGLLAVVLWPEEQGFRPSYQVL